MFETGGLICDGIAGGTFFNGSPPHVSLKVLTITFVKCNEFQELEVFFSMTLFQHCIYVKQCCKKS